MSGADELRAHAAAVAAAFGELHASRPVGVEALLAEPAVLDLHDRFVRDAAAIDAETREAFLAATGDRAAAVMQVVHADDLIPRVINLLDGVYGPGVWTTYPDREVDDLGPALAAFDGAVDDLRLLDDQMSAAIAIRVHQLFDLPVPTAGSLDPAAVAEHHASDLSIQLKAALALADAYVRAPFELASALVGLVELALEPAQTVGVVLRVARLSAVKVDAALG